MPMSASPSTSDPRTATSVRPDNPGVRLPPPVFYVAGFLIGLLIESRFPLPFFARPIGIAVGLALAAGGILFIVTAIPTMLHGHGTLNTAAPSASLVTSGPYRVSRNPMYVGLVLLYGGLACVFAVVWALPLLIPLIIYTQFGVIAPEERYLDRTFGDTYRVYRKRVRRWL
jgi:protein-S-isoprenylcysteine O-methyltransferase Ste14